MNNIICTIDDYLNRLPQDRRGTLQAVREVILANLPEGYQERVGDGMIWYVVPHSIYPKGYHCRPKFPLPLAALGSQKNHMALHLMNVYGDAVTARWFRAAWEAAGKKLDMGKACVRFKKLADVPLEVVGQVIARTPVAEYIARVEASLSGRPARRGKPRPRAAKR
jgi:hypothetical protein